MPERYKLIYTDNITLLRRIIIKKSLIMRRSIYIAIEINYTTYNP